MSWALKNLAVWLSSYFLGTACTAYLLSHQFVNITTILHIYDSCTVIV